MTSVVQTAAAIGGTTVGSPVAGGIAASVTGGIAATVDSYIKADVIPNPADPAHPLPDDKVSTSLNDILTTVQPDSVRDQYLQVEGYVRNNPDSAHFFDQPNGGSLLDWNNVTTPDGSGVNAWQDAYSKFANDADTKLHNFSFPAPNPSGQPITESNIAPRGDQRPPGAK
ncbi:hypothetical protein [Nocardia sp. NBC_00511]|uniref:hypothetical protein n=1 Tax=Nocardia sp. NBC_00511 TaxID=2903591 RepID=UPI0030E04F6F